MCVTCMFENIMALFQYNKNLCEAFQLQFLNVKLTVFILLIVKTLIKCFLMNNLVAVYTIC